jgi:hypothetical protein
MRGLRNDIVDGIGYIIHIQQGAILICHCPDDVIAVPGDRLKPGQAGARLYQRDPYPGLGQFPPRPTTPNPALMNFSAVARPNPEVAPVTMATRGNVSDICTPFRTKRLN